MFQEVAISVARIVLPDELQQARQSDLRELFEKQSTKFVTLQKDTKFVLQPSQAAILLQGFLHRQGSRILLDSPCGLLLGKSKWKFLVVFLETLYSPSSLICPELS